MSRFALSVSAALLFGCGPWDSCAVGGSDAGVLDGGVPDASVPTELYVVADAGSNDNDCLAWDAGCATIEGALQKFPADFTFQATVHVSEGQHIGAVVAGKRVLPASDGSSRFLRIKGQLSPYVPTSGTGAGTLTGFTAANWPAALATFTDSTQAWVPGELVGRLIEITSGVGVSSTSTYVIESNTATSINAIAFQGAAAGAVGSGYAIRDWATRVVIPVPADVNGPYGVSNWSAAGFRIDGNLADGNNGTGLMFEGLSVSVPSAFGFHISGGTTRVSLRWVKVEGGTSSVVVDSGAGVVVTDSYLKPTPLNVGLLTHGTNRTANGWAITRSLVEGGNIGVDGSAIGTVSTCVLKGQVTAAISAGTAIQIVNTRIQGGARGLFISNSSSGGGVGQIGVRGVDISGTTVAGVYFGSSLATADLGVLTGTGNALGIYATEGAKVNCTASCTITGTVADFQVDGVNYSQATLRTNSPRVVPLVASPFGSCVYE